MRQRGFWWLWLAPAVIGLATLTYIPSRNGAMLAVGAGLFLLAVGYAIWAQGSAGR